MTTSAPHSTVPATPDRAEFAPQWERWHQEVERRRADAHGFLAVTTLAWLGDEPQRIEGLPGLWRTGAQGPSVTLSADEARATPTIEVPEQGPATVTETDEGGAAISFGDIPERGGVTVRYGDIAIEVAVRGGHAIVRPRDPRNRLLADYHGTPVYPPNPRWIAHGRFVPFDTPQPTTVGSAAEGIEHVYEAPGVIEFTLRDETFRLTAFNGHAPGSLFVLFTDATSGLTTYEANRSLQVAAPAADGSVTLDFNRATNLPCAYTDHATCPLPPAGNHLPIGIEAGEKTPLERG